MLGIMADVRVRFAPSPTGSLHIGGVRSALYAWLWARQNGGKFILRIEDTDQERSTDESVQVVFDSLRWLGLDWDEGPEVGGDHGPYFQTKRLALYTEAADRLIAEGKAYRCWSTKEEMAAERKKHEEATGASYGFRFESPWRDRTDGDPNESHVIRFKAPREGSTGWKDLIKGQIDVPNETQQDMVLIRSNGIPLYNFGCVVDDIGMGINLVVRGDDHVTNTPRQILLYQALGAEAPTFAHMPMVLGPDGKRLSKRHGATGVLEYRDQGYLPDGMLNYLARLGWSHGDQEVFTRQELIEKFDWEHVGASGSKYDLNKLKAVNAEHLRMLEDDALATAAVPFLAERGLEVSADDATLRAALPFVKPRAETLPELADAADFFLRDAPVFDDKAKRKFLKPQHAEYLTRLADVVREVEPFDNDPLNERVMAWLEAEELKMKLVAQPARVAMTGRTRSPGLFEVMQVLGKERTLARLKAGAELAQAAAEPEA